MSSITAGVAVAHQASDPASVDDRAVVTSPAMGVGGSNDTTTVSDSTSLPKEGLITPAPPTGYSSPNSGEAGALPPLPKAVATSQETPFRESTNTTTATDNTNKTSQESSLVNPQTSGKDRKANSESVSGSEASDERWTAEGSIDLYCKRTGQSHAVLTSFGFWNCPKCDQSLRPPPFKKDDKSNSSSGKTQSAQSESDNFSYYVRYVDEEHQPICSEQWQGPFDLNEARKGVLSQIKTKPTLRVETVLETSILANKHRDYWEIEQIKKDGILDNPLVDVAVGRILVTVMSPALIQAIRKLVPYYPSRDLQGRTLELGRHNDLVWLHLDGFERYIEQPDEDNVTRLAKPHLRRLLALVENINGQGVADEKARHARGMCTYDMVWLLYKPGITVYLESHGSLAAFVVIDCEYHDARTEILEDRIVTLPRGWTVGLWNLDYDGSYVGRRARGVYLPPFEGERRITDLNIIPSKYKDEEDGGKLREALIKDGKRWFELLRGKQVSYSGRLLDDRKREVGEAIAIIRDI